MNNAIIITQSFSSAEFHDCMRLTYQRHATYARAHNMDYWHILGDIEPDKLRGGWGKVKLIQQALAQGYDYVFWIDADAVIVDMDTDLRTAFTGEGSIGCCVHDAHGIPRHLNVGVTFVHNTPLSKEFVDEWLNDYPGDLQWMEQGTFNKLYKVDKYAGLVFEMDNRFNSTKDVNEAKAPVIAGFHGMRPLVARLDGIRNICREDFLNFRV